MCQSLAPEFAVCVCVCDKKSEYNTSNVTRSPIHSKKQDNRKNSVAGGWRRQGKGGVGQNLKKGGR